MRGVLAGRVPRTLGTGALVALAAWAATARPASAIDFNRRFTIGLKVGDYFPADEQKGGFRMFGASLGRRSENAVQIGEVPYGGLSLGYGVKQWKRLQMSIELEASRISTEVGNETGYFDEDASTRIELPPLNVTMQTGDERFESLPLGDLTLTPVFANALFHVSGAANPERADFYFGAGLGMVLADLEESSIYREFAADVDGADDVSVDDAAAVRVKAGTNIRLSRNGNLFMFFEVDYFTTALLASDSQVTWSGTEFFGCDQAVDTDGNGVDDAVFPACFTVVDPGKVRMDGGSGAIGLRYRFGKGRAASEAAADTPAEPAATP